MSLAVNLVDVKGEYVLNGGWAVCAVRRVRLDIPEGDFVPIVFW